LQDFFLSLSQVTTLTTGHHTMNISREWATPLTMGAFGLMAVTGILMFFHLDTGLNKTVHEWAGWVMVAGVALHAVANAKAFIRHLTASTKGRAIVVVFAVVLAGSFFSLPPSNKKPSAPPVVALKAIARAPLTSVAPLAGKSVDQLLVDLESAGIHVASSNESLEHALGGDRGRIGRAINVIFTPKP
jgi:hypothetical protein